MTERNTVNSTGFPMIVVSGPCCRLWRKSFIPRVRKLCIIRRRSLTGFSLDSRDCGERRGIAFPYQFDCDVHEENRWIYHAYYMGKTGEEHVGLTLTKEYWEPVGEDAGSRWISVHFQQDRPSSPKGMQRCIIRMVSRCTVQPDAQTMNQLREYFEELNGRLLEQADGE